MRCDIDMKDPIFEADKEYRYYDDSLLTRLQKSEFVNNSTVNGESKGRNNLGMIIYKQIHTAYFFEKDRAHKYCYFMNNKKGEELPANLIIYFKNKWELNRVLKKLNRGEHDGYNR